MSNGKIRFGKQSGGTLGLVFPDGVDTKNGSIEFYVKNKGIVWTF